MSTERNILSRKFWGRIFLGRQGPRHQDIPDPNSGISRTDHSIMHLAAFCCLDGMSRDLGLGCPGIWCEHGPLSLKKCKCVSSPNVNGRENGNLTWCCPLSVMTQLDQTFIPKSMFWGIAKPELVTTNFKDVHGPKIKHQNNQCMACMRISLRGKSKINRTGTFCCRCLWVHVMRCDHLRCKACLCSSLCLVNQKGGSQHVASQHSQNAQHSGARMHKHGYMMSH